MGIWGARTDEKRAEECHEAVWKSAMAALEQWSKNKKKSIFLVVEVNDVLE